MLQSKAGYIVARPLTASSAKPLATHGRTIHWVRSGIGSVKLDYAARGRPGPRYEFVQSLGGARCHLRTHPFGVWLARDGKSRAEETRPRRCQVGDRPPRWPQWVLDQSARL